MKQAWFKNTINIASLFSFRMLGLFLLIPVFTVFANNLSNATPAMVGFALGAYGLTQSISQIPFGILSDKYGRKPIISIGFILLLIGSLIGAYTTSIQGMILARSLQGTGAIGSVLIALLSDLTNDSDRTKSMAVIGSTIGISFSIAIILGPYITRLFGLPGIFELTAILAVLGLIITHSIIPSPKKINLNTNKVKFKEILFNKHLMRLNVGIFFQHFLLTATFFAIPLLLQEQVKSNNLNSLWHFYLPLVIGSFLLMVPAIVFAERKNKIKIIFNLSVLVTLLAQIFLYFTYNSFSFVCVFMFLYFVAFNILEANLPSIVSRQANMNNRCSAMGIYSSCQFLGIFAGGSMAGLLFQWNGYQAIFLFNTLISFIWYIISWFMQPTNYQLIVSIPYASKINDINQLTKQLGSLAGVCHALINEQDKVIHLRVKKSLYIDGSAEKLFPNH